MLKRGDTFVSVIPFHLGFNALLHLRSNNVKLLHNNNKSGLEINWVVVRGKKYCILQFIKCVITNNIAVETVKQGKLVKRSNFVYFLPRYIYLYILQTNDDKLFSNYTCLNKDNLISKHAKMQLTTLCRTRYYHSFESVTASHQQASNNVTPY